MNCFTQCLELKNNGTWANIGDIDIQGDQITVEALIYMTSATSVNVVSKHFSPADVNYLLRPITFELTAYINGNSGPTKFLQMWNPITLSQNRWYHIAGTYNGSVVKYYIDGCQIIELPFTGNLYQNDFPTAIGNQSTCKCEQFLGKIDEVRIWNICRTQDEIQNNMLNLPNPTSQSGLVAYYKLDNSLINNQGNSTWNGSFIGSVQYSNDQANIQPIKITDIQIVNSDCDVNNGKISIFVNRPNSLYSIDGVNYQNSNIFNNLKSGDIQVFVKSPEGCVIINSKVTIGKNNLYNLVKTTKSICEGEYYFGHSNSGIYIDTIKSNFGCDTIRTIDLTVKSNSVSSIIRSICEGEVYEGYSKSGNYTDIFSAVNGCDSTRILILTVLPKINFTLNITICEGEVYDGYNRSGTYTDVFTATNGCDSTRTLYLTVLPNLVSNRSVTICEGDVYQGHSTSGIYTDVLTTANGCDSTQILVLTVLPKPVSTTSITICEGNNYEGYSTSGIFTDVFTTANGCDSTRILKLSVLQKKTSMQSITICEGELYEGYSKSGTYTDVFTATNGCDSTRILYLEIYNNSETKEKITICKGSVYNFNGVNIFSEGIYTDTLNNIHGCDSILTIEVIIASDDFLGNDVVLCDQIEYILNSSYKNARWFDNDVSQSKLISSSGLYWASIIDPNGCEIIDTISVIFDFKSYVPNVFSPNDDGINDCFKPFYSKLDFSVYRFSIFDRWGNLVYSTTNPNECWKGECRGEECSPGVYIYFVEVKTEYCNKTLIKGDVTLIK